ncbi:lipocalin-like domain-containing protein [Massilibacteroides vaginae]|uniref:lipocalin-like domain-containing protein n=1 Tax=Massilibacteroides vaginae TaxID=1673718 RepID=UPI000A1CC5B2|nr:lipocalin-like domain-containing protein [Massilibacteroides vaginae]
MIRRITALLAGLLILVSCSKDDDDKLEGKWQLRQVVESGQITAVDTVFYNFQTSLFMYQVYDPATDGMKHRYGFKTLEADKQLLLQLEYDGDFLQLTDWDSVKESFTIERLKGKELILLRNEKRYIFRKF